jgi:tRNA nucleotidyltransferase (CCA-adding enzyme)
LGVCRLWLEIPALVGKTPSQAVGALESVSPVVLYALTCMDLTPEAQELIRSYITRWQKLEPVTTGQKLRSLKVPPGPEYSRILNTLRAAWLDGRVKSEEEEERLLNRLLGR